MAQPGIYPDDPVAVPAFVLDGQAFSLGSPRRDTLRREIERLLKDPRSG